MKSVQHLTVTEIDRTVRRAPQHVNQHAIERARVALGHFFPILQPAVEETRDLGHVFSVFIVSIEIGKLDAEMFSVHEAEEPPTIPAIEPASVLHERNAHILRRPARGVRSEMCDSFDHPPKGPAGNV